MAEETVTADVQENDDAGVELEDIEVSPEELEGESEDDSEALATDDEDEPATDDESEEENSTDDSTTEPEAEEETEEVEQSDAEKQKAFNREQAQRRLQEKEARLLSVHEEQKAYIAEAEDEKDLALRQLQVDAYDNKVEANTNKLTNGFERAMKDFDVLRDTSPEIQAEVDQAIDDFQRLYVKIDAYGNPAEVSSDLYAYLQAKADSITKLTGIGARKQVEGKIKEKSKTSLTPSRAPKEPKKDADLDAFDEEASKW